MTGRRCVSCPTEMFFNLLNTFFLVFIFYLLSLSCFHIMYVERQPVFKLNWEYIRIVHIAWIYKFTWAKLAHIADINTLIYSHGSRTLCHIIVNVSTISHVCFWSTDSRERMILIRNELLLLNQAFLSRNSANINYAAEIYSDECENNSQSNGNSKFH